MKIYPISLPLVPYEWRNVGIGNWVSITGSLFTARDQAHSRLVNALKVNKTIPFSKPYPAIYYAGPTPAKPGELVGACGPTTSTRMDPFTPTLLAEGFRVFIGKGERSHEVVAAFKHHHGIYLTALGGCGALYQATIKNARCVAYEDLYAEAIFQLDVVNFLAKITLFSSI